MEHTFASVDPGLELRVLEGPQAGARAALGDATPCVLAAEPDGDGADIVLREEPASAARVRITAVGSEALLEVLHGQVQHGERTLASGEQLRWSMHAPLQIGRSLIAFGAASDEHWPRAMPTDEAPADADASATPDAPLTAPAKRGLSWLLSLGIAAALASIGVWGVARVMSAPRTEAAPPPSLAAALKASEFAALNVSHDASGRSELRGRLATLAERTRLDSWLAAREFTPSVEVRVDEGLVRDVTDVFRVNGVAVQARVQGPGHVAAEAAEPDAQRLARAEEVVRRDVRGLDKLSVINRAVPPPPPAPPVPDEPGKRIASLVPGDPAYLVTADGARYFIGALLPSGHRITHIAEQRVTLERDGRPSTLNF